MANVLEIIQNGTSYTFPSGGSADLSNYATKKYVDDAVAAIDIPEVDLTGYATEEYVDEAIQNIDIPEVGTNTIAPYVSPNLWNGEYKVGSFKATTGEIDETITTSFYAEVELEPNTDYTVYGFVWFVKYPADWSYSISNYKKLTAVNGTYQPITFNSGETFKYCRFGISDPSDKNYTSQQYYIVKGEIPTEKVKARETYFLPEQIKPNSFYKSVAYKLQDLTNPFKPTHVAMIGDSITAGYHSYNHAYITDCFAKLFGDYLLEQFNNKIYNIPMLDEHVINYGAGNMKNLETSSSLNQGDTYLQMDFYGSYIAINSYAGQKSNSNISIYIDGELYATHNFAETDTLIWEDENLTMDYHTIKITADASVSLGSFGIKKYVSFTNAGISGINSTTVRTNYGAGKYDEYDIIFCMIGTNDRTSGNIALYDYNIRQVFKHRLEAQGKQIILMSATPSPRETYPEENETYEGNNLNTMAEVVNWINLIGGKDNEQVISFYNWLLDYAADTEADLDTFFNDGLHPTEACHKLMFLHLLEECGFGKVM